MHSLLTNLADELLVQDITEPSAILGSFSGNELIALRVKAGQFLGSILMKEKPDVEYCNQQTQARFRGERRSPKGD